MFFKKIFFLLIFFITSNLFANEVSNIKTYDRKDYVRIVFETKEKPKYFVEQLDNKINIILQGAKIRSLIHKNIDKFDVIDNIIFINENKDKEKFAIILKNKATLKRYLYTDPISKGKPYRLVVDINRNITEQKNLDDLIVEFIDEKTINDLIVENVKPENISELLDLNNITDEELTKNIEIQNNEKIDMDEFLKKISVKIEEKPNLTIPQQIPTKKQRFVVVVDAGHGGRDPGAIGLFKTKEKNINLTVAKAIKYELDKNPKLRVYLTRSDDRFIELHERVNRSRNLRADLFISIHSDSNPNRKARGLSIYTLKKSASDVRTTKLYGSSKIMKNNSTSIKQDTLGAILDIARYENLNKSVKFTDNLVGSFRKQKINLLNNPHKYGNFAVLLAPEYPSVLIELGFISNPKDEKMLQSYDFRRRVSKSVAEAVRNYFRI